MPSVKRLTELGMNPVLAKEVASQIGPTNNTAIAALTTITTPDATDLASAQTLANATKAKVNAIIAALKGP